jgi:hypothetical protein
MALMAPAATGITIREERDSVPCGGWAVYFYKPRFVIREHGVPVGSISIDAPHVAKALASTLGIEILP